MDSMTEPSRYTKVRDLNSGTFGFVELAIDKISGQRVAIKFISRGEKVTKYVENEILNHRRLRHPHIVNFREVFLTPKFLAIAMDFIPGGDMFDYVLQRRGLTEDNARWFFQQLIVGVDYLHKMGVAYRDIKLENTLLDNSPRPLVKICDFGYSKHAKFQSAPGSRVGTPAYLAPEIVMNTKGLKYDGKVADIWACGVMLYVMMVGGYPFERPEDKDDPQKLTKMMQRILRVDYNFPEGISPSEECVDILQRILTANPEQRITIEQIQAHPWYQKNLPAGVLNMNDKLSKQVSTAQSAEDVLSIVEAAKHSLDKSANDPDDELLDEYLADDAYSSRPLDDWEVQGNVKDMS